MRHEAAVRVARPGDIDAMRAIERAAGTLFADIGMEDVAGHEPAPSEILLQYVLAGRAWMATIGSQPAGYALADVVDGAGHLEQVAIDPRFGRQGLGRALIEQVIRWARGNGCRAVTLLTFRDVPWNGPYYARLGFRALDDNDLTPELRCLRAHERDLGLDIGARCAMRLDLQD